jgi:hypothetical protein
MSSLHPSSYSWVPCLKVASNRLSSLCAVSWFHSFVWIQYFILLHWRMRLVLLQSCSWNTVLLVSLMRCFSLKLLCGLKNLQKFSPWEIVRHDIVYPIRFFGKVQAESDGSWVNPLHRILSMLIVMSLPWLVL